MYIPYNSDELEFSSEGVAPFDKEKYYEMNRFNVKIHNNDITVFHNRVLTDNLKNALQEYKSNKNVILQDTSKYDKLDSYEKLLNFEDLDNELQK